MHNRKIHSTSTIRYAVFLGIMVAILLLGVAGVSGNSAPEKSISIRSYQQGHFIGTAIEAEVSAAVIDSAPRYRTAPARLPRFDVERWPGELGDGLIFISQFYNPRQPAQGPAYLMILENNGELVYYNNAEGARTLFDFKKQANGELTYFVAGNNHNRFYAMNDAYRVVGTYDTVHEFPTDGHDLQVLGNGNALLLIHDHRTVDMSAYGGKTDADVVGCIIQEVDSDGDVVFEWDGWEYFEIMDTTAPLDNDPLLYTHCNSIGEDSDGNLLLSSRGLQEITKINRKSGDIIWRMGGKNNQFDFGDDYGFAFQHDARRIANGNLTVFDNGFGREPEHTRGLEYKLDETTLTATLVKEFRTTPDTWGPFMGNMQTLPNGNVVLGWGFSTEATLSELDGAGNQLLRMSSNTPTYSYRAFRFPWRGYPTWAPMLVAQLEGDLAKLYFSWNGSTETAAYEVYGGRNKNQLEFLAEVPKNGFETTYATEVTEDGFWYFSIKPIDKGGAIGEPSNLASVVRGGYSSLLPAVAAE